MKTVKVIILATIVACFIQACNLKSNTEPVKNIVINGKRTCYLPYELNPMDINDTINRMFYDGTKLGHWIIFEWAIPKGKQPLGAAVPPVRVKKEEGNYENGKKEGFWKFYRNDGTLRDSTWYTNGEPGC